MRVNSQMRNELEPLSRVVCDNDVEKKLILHLYTLISHYIEYYSFLILTESKHKNSH